MILKENLKTMTGQLYLEILKNNEIYDIVNINNTVMSAGRTLMSNLLVGNNVTNKKISRVGMGDGTALNDVNFTDLQGTTLYKKAITDFIFPDYNQVKINFNFGQNEGNSINVKEFGLFSNDGIIFNRVLWDGPTFIKTADFSLQGYFLITFN